MNQMGIWITFLVVIALLRPIPAEKKCDLESLQICLHTLQNLLEVQFQKLKKTEGELDEYCHAMKTDSLCLTEALDSCKADVPLIGTLSSLLDTYQKDFCTPDAPQRKLYLKTVTCLVKYENEYKDCQDDDFDGEDMKSMCLAMKKTMECMEETGLKTCGKDGKTLVTSLQAPWRGLMKEQCAEVDEKSNSEMHHASYLSFILPASMAFVLGRSVFV